MWTHSRNENAGIKWGLRKVDENLNQESNTREEKKRKSKKTITNGL